MGLGGLVWSNCGTLPHLLCSPVPRTKGGKQEFLAEEIILEGKKARNNKTDKTNSNKLDLTIFFYSED